MRVVRVKVTVLDRHSDMHVGIDVTDEVRAGADPIEAAKSKLVEVVGLYNLRAGDYDWDWASVQEFRSMQ